MPDLTHSQPSLSSRMASSALWMTGNSLVSKAVSLVGQLILARLLLPSDFGLIGLALTVTVIGDVINQFGLGDVVVNRARRLRLWATAAFSLAIVIGILSTVIMLALAPLAAYLYDDQTVGYLVAIMALATPFQALGIVPLARLRAELRFKEVAVLQGSSMVVAMLITIGCASAGFGAYSFALGRILSEPISQIVIFYRAKLPLKRQIQFRRWRYLFADSTYAFVTSLLNRVIMQGDYIVLGLFFSKAAVGQYFMAFTLSVQAIGLAANNLAVVMFPGLTKLSKEPERQVQAFMRGSKSIAFVAVPICFLQVAVADSAVRLLLGEKWLSTIPLIQILSLGMAFRATGWMWNAMLKARGLYMRAAIWSLCISVVFISVAIFCAYQGDLLVFATGVSVFYIIVNLIQVYLSCRPASGLLIDTVDLFFRPLLIAALSFSIPWYLMRLEFIKLSDSSFFTIDIAVITCFGFLIYFSISYFVNRQTLTELFQHLPIPGAMLKRS